MDKETYTRERIAVQHRKAKAELCEARAQMTLAEGRLCAAVASFNLIDSARAFNDVPIIEAYAEESKEIS